jgi:tetratricopeptide (TPR) repeat protein
MSPDRSPDARTRGEGRGAARRCAHPKEPARGARVLLRRALSFFSLLALFYSGCVSEAPGAVLPSRTNGPADPRARLETPGGVLERAGLRDSLQLVLDRLMDGHLRGARSLVERLGRERPEEPWVRLIGVRVAREEVDDQHRDKDRVASQTEPLLRELEGAERAAEARIEAEPSVAEHRLLRGWIRMFRARLHALSKSFLAAASAARGGKGDLERCLEIDPDNADAKGVLGIYLYFADSLPTVFKILRSILFIPGGDRERGLEYLRESGEAGGLASIDSRLFRAAILVGFEGRLEEGYDAFRDLQESHPGNPRFSEPMVLAALLLPEHRPEASRSLEAALASCRDSGEEAHRRLAWRLRYYRAQLALLAGDPDAAERGWRAILDQAPESPDWLLGATACHYTALLQVRGETARARVVPIRLRSRPRGEDAGEELVDFLEKRDVPDEATAPGTTREEGTGGTARERLGARAALMAGAVEHLTSGGPEGARPLFERLEPRKGDGFGDLLAVQALVGLGRLDELAGRNVEARRKLERARDLYGVRDLLGVVFDSRIRYLERLGEAD